MNTVNLLPSATAQSTLDSRFHAFGWGPEAEIPFQCIHHAIDTQIALQPQAVAVEHLDHSISYADLDRLASSLAARLAADGVRQGDAVGLFMRRGIHLVVGILAVLRLGAAYVPKDAAIVPHTMLQQVIDGARIRTVLTTRDHVDGLAADLARANLMQVDLEQLAQDRASAPAVCGDRSDRCFVLFTSGTTGVPNGVEVTHANVCNLLLCSPGDLGIRAGTRVGNVLNIAFDMASWEILACLANGGTLVVRGSDFAACAAQVNVLIATPSILARLNPEDCPTMEAVAVAGEPCPQPLAEKWAAKCRFYIGCGPTEVTIVNTLGQYHCGDDAVTIGAPVPNTTVYVLDENLRPCAIGEVGEMWAGGDCVSHGYANNEQLTQERYLLDPFLGGGRLMFRTRDLGRWTEDGRLEMLGRVDDQVKVRGFRVELDSVSGALESLPGCQRAVTIKATDRHLVAFVSPASVDLSPAKARVAERLPYYCVPTLVISMDTLPMTPRGKVDKRLLLQMAEHMLEEAALEE